jgi:hypothetical protein
LQQFGSGASSSNISCAYGSLCGLVGGFTLGTGAISKQEAVRRDERARKELVALAKTYAAQIVDPLEYLCSDFECPVRDSKGYPLYKDADHFAPDAAARHLTFIGQALGLTIDAAASGERGSLPSL